MARKNIYAQIRDEIGDDNLGQALNNMKQLLKNSPKLDEVIQQSGRFKNIQKQIQLGTISYDNAILTTNQIRIGLLDLLREMETGKSIPAIQKAANEPKTIQSAEEIFNTRYFPFEEDNVNASFRILMTSATWDFQNGKVHLYDDQGSFECTSLTGLIMSLNKEAIDHTDLPLEVIKDRSYLDYQDEAQDFLTNNFEIELKKLGWLD